MNRNRIIALAIFSFLIANAPAINAIEIFKSRVKDPGKFDALCAVSGKFDGCDVSLENNSVNSISIDGARDLDLCNEKTRIGYRSNPASPYKRVHKEKKDLEEIAKSEKGIDHDFLIAVPKLNSVRRETLIVRFKNHRVAVAFAKEIDNALTRCSND